MRPTSLLSAALLLAATSDAWPWPPAVWQPAFEVARRQIEPLIAPRADSSTTSNTESNTASATSDTSSNTDATSTTDASSTTGSSNSDASSTGSSSASGTDKSSGSSTITSAAKSSGSGTSGKSSTTASKTSFSANLPAGGISMITPNAYSTSYYKIGQPVTFAWNYTSLSVTPSAVDVLATTGSNTYTIALNQSIPNATQTVVWDTGAWETSVGSQLAMGTYTLVIYDAESSVSATAEAGYLGVSDTFSFGMYEPQPYSDSAVEYQCITCSNDAMARMQKMTVGLVFGMAAVTVLSFTWFAGVAGIL